MSYELTGRLYEKNNTVVVSDKFRKRELVIEKTETTNSGEFTELIKFQLSQDRCDLLDKYDVGNEVSVNFNIKGRKWEKDGKVSYFTTLEVWKIESAGQTQPQNKPEPELPDDDLPF